MSVTYPSFLLGLLAIAIPIAIHLFELRRPQRVLFTNVEFIREVKLVSARQRKLKHLLVLASRIGLIVCLTLLFAQPFIPAAEQGSNTNGTIGVLIDQSPSMAQLGPNGQPVFENAIKEADDLPLAFFAITQFSLSEKSKPITASAYRAEVQQLQISGQADKLKLTSNSASAVSAGPQFIFSDFQKSSFSARTLASFDTSRQTYLVPLAGTEAANVFIDSVWLDDAFIRANVDAVLRVRLRNGGQKAVSNCPVKVFVGTKQAAALQLSVPAQEAVTTAVRIRLDGEIAQQCRVEIEDSPVVFDNTFYFMLRPSARIRIVEVGADATLYSLYGNEPLFSYQHANSQLTDYRAIAEANLILLREAGSLPIGLRESIRRAVQQGASVVIVPSASAASRAAYTSFFRELGIGGIQWEDQSAGKAPALRDVAEPSRQNPFFKEVFVGQSRAAGMPKVAPVLRWARSGSEILRLRDGEGFLASFPSGKGTVYLFSAPFSQSYSDFTQNALFVPVMYRLAMQSYQQEQQLAYRLNDRTFSVSLSNDILTRGQQEQVFQLRRDSASYIPTQRIQGGRLVLDVPPGLQAPGFYTLVKSGTPVSTLAFNIDKQESNLASYTATELKQLIGTTHPNVHVYDTGAGQTVAAQYKATRVGIPLWRYCLLGALICLLAEGVLLRLGGRRQVASAAQVSQAA
ncbi:BatA domain-containing protein [Hymenobacter fodinae]|uniref:Aerotolerance regulator N-terminal domain-containing protein n=1 Tax=Hymenobacter fodinae TaxID=2510796 RepID=A0A4Z0P5I8_9BACT|nr:BatA domain-containing protein [Hymenobacter fodinae]TGE06690.1 hypothetical protein EU556_17830 [Hymenobacter fodinae]